MNELQGSPQPTLTSWFCQLRQSKFNVQCFERVTESRLLVEPEALADSTE